MATFWIKKEVINTQAPKLTPQEKIEFEAIHILIENTLHVSSKENGTHFCYIFMRFDIKFLENPWEFNHGVTWRSELKWEVSNGMQNITFSC